MLKKRWIYCNKPNFFVGADRKLTICWNISLWVGEINHKFERSYRANQIDRYPWKSVFNFKIIKNYVLLFWDNKLFPLCKAMHPFVIRYRTYTFRQAQFYLLADKLSCHKAHGQIKRILAFIFCFLVDFFAGVGKMPNVYIALPSFQRSLARWANATTLFTVRNSVDVHKRVVRFS